MFRVLRTLATGLVAVAALGWTAACGVPDAGPVLDTMESQARERGLADRISYRPTSDGTPGTQPMMRGDRWEATSAEFTELVDLLQDNMAAAQDAGYDRLTGNVVVGVEQTEIQLRTVPGPATQEVLEALISPGVTRLEVNSHDLVFGLDPEAYRLFSSAAPQLSAALAEVEDPAKLVITSNHTGARLVVHPGSLTAEGLREILVLTDRLRTAAGDMHLAEITVRDGRIDSIVSRNEAIEPRFITALAQVAPDGTRLSIGHSDAIIGGQSAEPPASEEERLLRELVERPS